MQTSKEILKTNYIESYRFLLLEQSDCIIVAIIGYVAVQRQTVLQSI